MGGGARRVRKGFPPPTDGPIKGVEHDLNEEVFSGARDPRLRYEAACFERGGFVV